jgi:hypothetical protein
MFVSIDECPPPSACKPDPTPDPADTETIVVYLLK